MSGRKLGCHRDARDKTSVFVWGLVWSMEGMHPEVVLGVELQSSFGGICRDWRNSRTNKPHQREEAVVVQGPLTAGTLASAWSRSCVGPSVELGGDPVGGGVWGQEQILV